MFTSSANARSEEHTSELQSPCNLVCRLLPRPPSSALFPYTTLFRSKRVGARVEPGRVAWLDGDGGLNALDEPTVERFEEIRVEGESRRHLDEHDRELLAEHFHLFRKREIGRAHV